MLVRNDEHLDGGAEVEHLLAVAVLTAVVRGDEDVDAVELATKAGFPQELPPALQLHVTWEDELVLAAGHEHDEAQVVLVGETKQPVHVFTGGRPPAFEDYGDTSFTAYWNQKMGYQSQETVDRYRAYARGFNYQGDIRHVLTTRRERRKREKLFEALLHQLEALAREKPVLMIFEDVHSLDPTSRELLDLTMDRAQRVPVLLIVTFRPEFQPPWGDQSHVTMLRLNRLGGGATARRFLSALRVEDQTTI